MSVAERIAFSISAGGARRPRELERGALVERKPALLAIRATDGLAHRESWLGKPQREVHASDHRGAEPIDVVGDPDRRGRGPLDQPVHEHLAAAPVRGVVLVDADEQVVRLVDDDDRLSRHTADRVGDHQGGDALAAAGLGVFVVGLADELHREADVARRASWRIRSCRFQEGHRREGSRRGGSRVSGFAGGGDDPGGEIAQVAQMLEVAPSQRGAGGFAEQEIADPARSKPRQGEEAANDDRQARALHARRSDRVRQSRPPDGEFAPVGTPLEERMKVKTVGAFEVDAEAIADGVDESADLGRLRRSRQQPEHRGSAPWLSEQASASQSRRF